LTVVVDASLALKWALHEEHTDQALALWDRWQEASEQVIAPPLFRAEVTNVLHQMVRRGHLNHDDAADILESLTSIVESSEPTDLYHLALALASRLSLGATYDALYIALADIEGCEMWTADRRLVRSVQERVPQVRWIGELP
jgi:predicted nucleic acid-binding protein